MKNCFGPFRITDSEIGQPRNLISIINFKSSRPEGVGMPGSKQWSQGGLVGYSSEFHRSDLSLTPTRDNVQKKRTTCSLPQTNAVLQGRN